MHRAQARLNTQLVCAVLVLLVAIPLITLNWSWASDAQGFDSRCVRATRHGEPQAWPAQVAQAFTQLSCTITHLTTNRDTLPE